MDASHNQLTVSQHQLDKAISLFLDETDYYCAATLTGAAEEILGCLLSDRGDAHALDQEIAAVLKMLAPAEIDALSDGTNRKPTTVIQSELNAYRNWLKHYQKDNFNLCFDARDAASELIDRAVMNFWQLVQRETELMKRFREWQMSQYS